MVPRLRVGRPNFELRLVQTRIIEARSRDTLSLLSLPAEQPRAAFRAKSTLVFTNHLARGVVIFRRTFRDLECFRRHIENGSKRTAGRLLTITAMAIEHHDRFGRDFITNRAARASTSKFRRHLLR